ncbi:S-adenosyl-L-methionine-dependent methyltransferase [Apiospora arundinis]|uniref:S-adenosyl-L-methionine-dependent methyltransferase n=1 Tax=Apiospora arundinis TaxID=335852 RepID=A0ABR2HQ39_9PEZI
MPSFNPFVPTFEDEELVRVPSGASIVEPESVLGESGRSYHGYKEGKYLLPNDAAEQDRLDFQHTMVTLMLDGKLALAPMTQAPGRVLDVATGTGIWALEFARSNPTSEVIGTDLSKIQPNPDVPNCHFEKMDSEDPWLFTEKFDFVHIRFIVSCIRDPPGLIREAYDNLKPGGWLEMQDCHMEFLGDDPALQGSALQRWSDYAARGALTRGYDLRKAKYHRQWLIQAGFTEVKEIFYRIPCSPWPTEAKDRRIGEYQQRNSIDGLRGASYLMLRNAGLSPEEVETLISDAKNELRSQSVKAFAPFYVVYGRKPL